MALMRAGVLTSVSDGTFAVLLGVLVFNSTFARTWQGVAAVPLGRDALNGGTATVLIGLALHVCVAFAWSAVFLFVLMRPRWVRALLVSPFGAVKVALLYGPAIWLVMSLVVVPTFTGRAPAFTRGWWILLIGHAPFVGFPIAWIAVNALKSGETFRRGVGESSSSHVRVSR